MQEGEDTTEPAEDVAVDGLTYEVMPLGKGHRRAAIGIVDLEAQQALLLGDSGGFPLAGVVVEELSWTR